MAIKLAFSTVACPDWTIAQVAQKAKEFGYQGVELRTLGPGSSALASEPAETDPRKITQAFQDAGIEPVCLSTSASLHHRNPSDGYAAVRQAESALELADKIACPTVRLFVNKVEPGEVRETVMRRVAERLNPLAEKGGKLGVTILLENAGSFAIAKPWWWLLNLIEHPMVKLCWNVANAAAAGEGPAVSVSQLNSRIALAKVKDTRVGEGSGFVPLGEGTVQVQHFIKRLLGIGYDGYVSVEWDRLWLPSLAPPEEYLPDAQKRLTTWLKEINDALAKGPGDASSANKLNTPEAHKAAKAKAAAAAAKKAAAPSK